MIYPRPSSWTESFFEIAHRQVRHWSSNSNPKKILIISHGQGEHSGRYAHFTHFLNHEVHQIYALDHLGHGKSEGARGHVESFQDYTDPLKQLIQLVHSKNPEAQIHLLGHSLGGLIVLKTIQESLDLPLKSVIVSAPLLDLAFPAPPVKKFFGELLEPVLGKISLSNELDPSWISHDPQVVAQYQTDPLNHNRVTLRFFVQMQKAMASVKSFDGELNLPFMMIVPLEDKIVSADSNRKFFADLKFAKGINKELQMFPHFYHEAFNDLGNERVFNCLNSWLKKF
ncbi:MAG: alpha/beta hydrolase [Proteobacteria bacterium]|jgi:lysophospholipase|nr:alpha/beta hydrolase [Pseudomonadota bacterium]